jgi:2-polyprenyl-3-methyl-5-hydroxy-6-metoxy-1,4-benzoquinol methylase
MDTPISPLKFKHTSWMLTFRDLFTSSGKIMGEVSNQPRFRVLDYGCGIGIFTLGS